MQWKEKKIMETDSMNCLLCCLKHVACSLSYAKQIMNGHGKNSELDHRIDFLGQLVNLEHHLSTYNQKYAFDVREYREGLQNRSMMPKNDDLDILRKIYSTLQSGHIPIQQIRLEKLDSFPSIVFLNINNAEYFNLCYTLIKRFAKNYSKIYYIDSNIDLAEYADVSKISFADIQEKYVWLFNNEQTLIIRETELDKSYPLTFNDDFPKLIEKDKYKPYFQNRNIQEYIKNNKIQPYPFTKYGFILDKKICCSNTVKMKNLNFCVYTSDQAFQSIKKYFDIDHTDK